MRPSHAGSALVPALLLVAIATPTLADPPPEKAPSPPTSATPEKPPSPPTSATPEKAPSPPTSAPPEKAPSPPTGGAPKKVAFTPEPYVPFWTPQRIVAVESVGLGFTGMFIGIGFGADAQNKASAAKSHCAGTPVRCDAEGISMYSNARSSAMVANIAFAAGGLFLLGGFNLWILAPSPRESPKKPATPVPIALVPSLGGLTLSGAF